MESARLDVGGGSMVRATLALFVLVLVCAPARAQEKDPAELALTTERVVLFKDGYGLVVKRGRASAGEDGVVHTDAVPDAAVLGTFWASAAEGSGRLLSVDAGKWRGKTAEIRERGATGLLDLLAMNVEATVRLRLRDGAVLDGVIERVMGDSVLMQVGNGQVLVRVDDIRGVEGEGLRQVREETVLTDVERKRLTFRYDGAGEKTLDLVYFRPSLRWIPTYRLEIPEDGAGGQARMALQAEILNEAEDFGTVPLHLVVGVPNFRFRDVVSPFTLEPMLRNALAQAAPQLMGQMMSNSFRMRGGEFRGAEAAEGAFHVPDEIVAGSVQDLFVYELPPTPLMTGHRVAVPIFEASVPVRHLYTWDVHVTRTEQASAPTGSPIRLATQQVWHQVELRNDSRVPWTTGGAFLMQGARPLGQELLTYTSRGASVRVPVTVAVDVAADYEEEETSRSLNALNVQGYTYARIDQTGRLSLMNHRPHPIDVEVTVRIGGRVDEADEGGEVSILPFSAGDWPGYQGHPSVNNSSLVRFALRLAPRERLQRAVHFHYFARQ
jgi:hypothetical protein